MCTLRPVPTTYDELVDRIYERFHVTEMRLVNKSNTGRGWDPFRDPEPSGSKTFTDINPQAIRRRLNECFGIGGWTFEETTERVTSQRTRNNKTEEKLEVLCSGRLSVSWKGTDGKEFTREITGHGSAEIGGNRFEVGDAYKAAGTAALSKAASVLGIGDEVYSGRVDAAEWVRRCQEAGIHSMQQWELHRSGRDTNSGAPSPARSAGPSSPANSPDPNGGTKTPAQGPAGTDTGAGGRREGRGDRPLWERLYDVAKLMGHTNDWAALNSMTKSALNIDPKEKAPRLVDIKDPSNQKRVLSELIGAACAGNGGAEKWLQRYGYTGLGDFIKLACDGKITCDNLSDLAKSLDSGDHGPDPVRDDAEPLPVPTGGNENTDPPIDAEKKWNLHLLLNAFAGMRITRMQIKGALGRKLSEADVPRFSRIYMAMEDRPGLDLRHAMDEVKS